VLAAEEAAAPSGQPVTMPCPPGLDPGKWATLDRKTRRELWRHHRKLQKRAGR
jgi:protein-disulfide isomerase-like protein with CxxC motif